MATVSASVQPGVPSRLTLKAPDTAGWYTAVQPSVYVSGAQFESSSTPVPVFFEAAPIPSVFADVPPILQSTGQQQSPASALYTLRLPTKPKFAIGASAFGITLPVDKRSFVNRTAVQKGRRLLLLASNSTAVEPPYVLQGVTAYFWLPTSTVLPWRSFTDQRYFASEGKVVVQVSPTLVSNTVDYNLQIAVFYTDAYATTAPPVRTTTTTTAIAHTTSTTSAVYKTTSAAATTTTAAATSKIGTTTTKSVSTSSSSTTSPQPVTTTPAPQPPPPPPPSSTPAGGLSLVESLFGSMENAIIISVAVGGTLLLIVVVYLCCMYSSSSSGRRSAIPAARFPAVATMQLKGKMRSTFEGLIPEVPPSYGGSRGSRTEVTYRSSGVASSRGGQL